MAWSCLWLQLVLLVGGGAINAPTLGDVLGAARGHQSVALQQTVRLHEHRGDGDSDVPVTFTVTSLRKFPHVDAPWTQGLEYRSDGLLVESVGSFPEGTQSLVRLIDPATGSTVQRSVEGLQMPRFAEGITQLGDRWFASTYLDHVALEYDSDFKLRKEHRFDFEGWGLAHDADGRSLLATNGSVHLMYLDPATFEARDTKVITCMGKPVGGMNELEMVPNFEGMGPTLLGNLIMTRLVLAVDPATAKCKAVFRLDGEGVEPIDLMMESGGMHVANGIAYNAKNGTLYVTGKNWETMSEVRLKRGTDAQALQALQRHIDISSKASLLETPWKQVPAGMRVMRKERVAGTVRT